MKMDLVAGSGNDEFYTPSYAVEPLLKYIPKDKTVWCPFDTEASLIVHALRNNGNEVVATHLTTGQDFFITEPMGDLIVSNPPYSMKTEVFHRLFQLNKPFAMLVGVVGLFESQKRFDLFKDNDFEVMWMDKRIAYFKSYEEQTPSLNPPFSSVWLTRGVLPKANVFERIIKPRSVKWK
jgi:hypothetical protein